MSTKSKIVLTSIMALGVSGLAFAGGGNAAASAVQKASIKTPSSRIKIQPTSGVYGGAGSGLMVGATIGMAQFHGDLKDKVKRGSSMGVFAMLPVDHFIVGFNIGRDKLKAKSGHAFGLEKTSFSAGLYYNIVNEDSINVAAGGELGYADYKRDGTGGAGSSDQNKFFQQLDVLAGYNFGGNLSAIAKVGYNFTKAKFSDFPIKDSNLMQFNVGVGYTFA